MTFKFHSPRSSASNSPNSSSSNLPHLSLTSTLQRSQSPSSPSRIPSTITSNPNFPLQPQPPSSPASNLSPRIHHSIAPSAESDFLTKSIDPFLESNGQSSLYSRLSEMPDSTSFKTAHMNESMDLEMTSLESNTESFKETSIPIGNLSHLNEEIVDTKSKLQYFAEDKKDSGLNLLATSPQVSFRPTSDPRREGKSNGEAFRSPNPISILPYSPFFRY